MTEDLEEMIVRAQLACQRYRKAAAEPGLSLSVVRRRQARCLVMERMLAWLKSLDGEERVHLEQKGD